jgi:GntR family transcriptional repressor for pyruvate dehydrogenase complex
MTDQSMVPRLTTAEDVSRQIEESILAGERQPGTKLESERQLAERFGVGRPMVREALKRLEERGLIEIHAARGSFVRGYHPSQEPPAADLTARRARINAFDLSRARQLLESESAALAAQYRTDAELEEMGRLLQAFDAGGPAEELAELDLAFHGAIVVASQNVALQVMFGSIRTMTKALMLRSLTDRAVSQAGAPIHRTIFEAIRNGDADAARAGMLAHLKIAESYYGSDLDAPLADVLRRRAATVPSAADALRNASSRLEALSDDVDDDADAGDGGRG